MLMTYKWRALFLLWVAFFLQQGTRQIFGATLSSIQGSLGVTAAQIGMIATVFTFVYGISVPFAGVTADLLNRKWMVVSGVFVFCLGIFCSGFISSLGLLLVTYGILNGFGQSFYYPSATSIIGELHKETRATALSILQMGFTPASSVVARPRASWRRAAQRAGACHSSFSAESVSSGPLFWRWDYEELLLATKNTKSAKLLSLLGVSEFRSLC